MNPNGLRAAAQDSLIRINAAGAQDARGPGWAPASLLIDARRGRSRPGGGLRLLAVGSPEEVDRDERARSARVVEMPRTVVLPGMVNAHSHLDLTHIGPRPHQPELGFMPWVELIRASRASSEDEVRVAVARGIELSRSAGVLAVGDIAGAVRTIPPAPPNVRASTIPLRVMRERGMAGVSFLEFFAIGAGRNRFRQWLPQLLEEELRGSQDIARIGLQPHASNTVCLAAYRWAQEFANIHGIPLCTHLAESPEERRFIAEASGPMRELLERLGLWDESVAAEVGRGVSPVAHVAGTFRDVRPLVAHVNDAADADLDLLAAMNAAVVYCPHASEYFGAAAHFGPHRYRDMLLRGIPVALGTDSLVNLPAAAARSPAEGGTGISIFEEMRLLARRDGTEGRTLLAMATVNGARVLGLLEERFVLAVETEIAGLVGVDIAEAGMRPTPLNGALRGTQPAQLLLD